MSGCVDAVLCELEREMLKTSFSRDRIKGNCPHPDRLHLDPQSYEQEPRRP